MNVRGLDVNSGIVYNYLLSVFDIDTIVPLFYQGNIAGSEFLTYAANKVYLCLEFEAGTNAGESNVLNYITFYNESNTAFFYLRNEMAMFDNITPTTYLGNNLQINNLYFSRIVNTGFLTMKFVGYRITLV